MNEVKTKHKKRSPILYVILKPAAVFLFKLIVHPKIEGKNNIPKSGSVIIAGNHTKSLDCFMVMAGTNRCIHFLAKSELFKNPFLKWFFNSAGLIPVHRNRKDHNALVSAIDYLDDGAVIGIFPEGKTNRTHETPILQFKMGAVKMAYETKSPIVPFTIKGKYKLFKSSIEIIFQEPYYLESDNLSAENEKLMNKVLSKI